jgi:hypothetical protein
MLDECSSENHAFNLSYVDERSQLQGSFPTRHTTNQKESDNLLEESRQKCAELELENQELRILLNHAQTGSYCLIQRATAPLR